MHDVRIIPTDNSPHPQNYWAWDGDSRGRWEGDTLVVDVSNFNGRTWLDMAGEFRRRERTRRRAIHAGRCRHDPLRGDHHRPDGLRQAGADALHAEASARRAADSRIQLPRRRAKPAALHRRGRRQEAEGEMKIRAMAVAALVATLARRGCRRSNGGPARRRFLRARLWDGKTPDFRGIWQVRDTAYVNIEGHPAEKGIAAVEEHHRRSARWEDSVQTGGACDSGRRTTERASDRRSVAQVLSGRRSPRDLSSDSAADSSEPGQLRDCLPGESRLPRLPPGHAAALRQHRLVDGRHALSVGGGHAGRRRRRADRSGMAGPGGQLSQHRGPHRRALPDDRAPTRSSTRRGSKTRSSTRGRGRCGPFCIASSSRERGSSRTNAWRTRMASGIIFRRTIPGTC